MVQSNIAKNAADTVPPDTPFEAALAELERIVEDMEGGGLPLEESITAYRRGSELLRHCQGQLADAERRIRVFENGEPRGIDLEGETGP